MIKIGDRIKVEGSDFIPNGTYKVLVVSEKNVNPRGTKRAHVQVLSRNKKNPDWEPTGWWVEDKAIVND